MKPQATQSQSAADSNTASKSAASASTSKESASKSAASVAGDSKASSNSSPKSSAYVMPKATAKVDLSDPSDYYDMNVFLSNFAEWSEFYRDGAEFDREDYDLEQIVNWAMWHNAINDETTLVTKTVEIAGATPSQISKTIGNVPATSYPRHMSTALIEDTISRYLGIDVNLKDYDSKDGAYYERDGKLYEGLYRGDAVPCDNVALADKVLDLDEDTVCVVFTIYSGNASTKVVSDDTWYSMSGNKLKSAMRAAGSKSVVIQTGTAYVQVVEQDGNRTFKLVSFKMDEPDEVKIAL